MRRFAGRGRARLGLGQLEAQPAESDFDLGDAGRRDRLALARVASRARADSIVSAELPVLPREQHLLPAPQLVAQPLVAPRLRRLPLQRAALLLDLEHDVVDARQVLLRRLELQLRGAPARLVLGDARPLPRSAAGDRSAAS